MKKCLSIIFCFIISFTSFSEIRKSSNAAFSIGKSQDAAIENPYITDGLVTMWDGEWNVGLGKHSDTATVWKDLISSQCVPAVGIFGQNYQDIVALNNRINIVPENIIPDLQIATIEMAFTNYGTNNDANFSMNFTVVGNNVYARFGHLGGHSTTTSGQGTNRYGFIFSNQLAGVVGINIVPLDMPYSASYSMHYYASSADRKKLDGYVNGQYSKKFIYANETQFTGKLMVTQGKNTKYRIYSIRIYNRILSAEEIAYNYEIDKMRFNLP